MIAPGPFRATLMTLALAAAIALPAPAAWAQARGPSYLELSAADAVQNRPLYLGINRSMVIELPRAAGDVLVSNPAIADAVLRTSTRLYLIGVQLGQANVFLFDGAGEQIASFDVYVEADLGALNQILAEAVPNGFVRADALNGSIVLRGQVASSAESSKAEEITGRMLAAQPSSVTNGATTAAGGTSTTETFGAATGPGIVNLLTIMGEEQVSLKVTIAEVQRSVVKQLGINVKGSAIGDDYGVGTNLQGPFGVAASGVGLSPLVNPDGGEIGFGFSSGDFDIQATLRALDETNMIRTLAEPTLTAVSGETAEFLAGGEFGYPIQDDDDSFTVEFKEFGVKLAFTPVVLSPGRISLKVRTSVSEITGTVLGVPSLSTRRAETTVEQPSGGSFVIGGLVRETTRRAATGFPVLKSLPILGALFASKSFQADETELVMIVTPYLVKPVSPRELARPDDNLAFSSDADAYFHDRVTKIYGRAEASGASAAGQVGFTFD